MHSEKKSDYQYEQYVIHSLLDQESNILLVFETLLPKETCFRCLASLISAIRFYAAFSCFSVVSQSFFPFGILAYDYGSFGCGNSLDCLDFGQGLHTFVVCSRGA